MRKYLLVVTLSLIAFSAQCADTLSVCSPSKNISVKIWMDKTLNYCIYSNGKMDLMPSVADMLLNNNQSFSTDNRITSHTSKPVTNEIISPVPEKRKKIKDVYNLLSITFRKPYKVEFRAYDDGVAYRFATSFKDSITVQNEVASFHFAAATAAYFPGIHKRDDADIFHTSFEEQYPLRQLDSIKNTEMGYTPVL